MAFGGENPESYYDEGLTLAMKGDVHRAVQYFERAIHMDNTMTAAYHQLAKCYQRIGDYGKAVQLLQRVVQAKPRAAAARLDLGHALLKDGDADRARQAFQSILSEKPDNARAKLGLAEVQFFEGNWPGAVALAQEALEAGAGGFATIYLLGRAARLAGNKVLSDTSLERADKLAEKSIDSNPQSPEGYFLRGQVHFAKENFGEALEFYRKAEDTAEPDKIYTAYGENFADADIICKQGLCFQRLGQDERARERGEAVLKIDPEHKLALALTKL